MALYILLARHWTRNKQKVINILCCKISTSYYLFFSWFSSSVMRFAIVTIMSDLAFIVSCKVVIVSTSLFIRSDSLSALNIDPVPSRSHSGDISGKAAAIPIRVFALGSTSPFICLSKVCCFSEHLIARARTERFEYARIFCKRSTIVIVIIKLKSVKLTP